jgi:hypothetical protein
MFAFILFLSFFCRISLRFFYFILTKLSIAHCAGIASLHKNTTNMREHIRGMKIPLYADSSPLKVTVQYIFCIVPEKSFGLLFSSAVSPFSEIVFPNESFSLTLEFRTST